MASDHFVLSIVKLGLGCLERTTESAGRPGLAGVDLRSGDMREEDNLLACWSLNRVRHVGWRFFLRVGLGVSDLACQNEDNQPDDEATSLRRPSHEGDCSRAGGIPFIRAIASRSLLAGVGIP